jgi:hypothetical protein
MVASSIKMLMNFFNIIKGLSMEPINIIIETKEIIKSSKIMMLTFHKKFWRKSWNA